VKAAQNFNEVAKELTHIGAMVQRLERLVQGDCIDRPSTVVAMPAYWRARIEANAELPPALQPQARLLLARLATLEARAQFCSSTRGGNARGTARV
jgi:hypothetical protein